MSNSRFTLLARALSLCLPLTAALAPAAQAYDPPFHVSYAINTNGAWGWAVWNLPAADVDRSAMDGCGGAANGCFVALSVRADCVGLAESRSAAGFWYWVAYTREADAYSLNAERRDINDRLMGWCNASDAPDGTCQIVDIRCMDYIQNIN